MTLTESGFILINYTSLDNALERGRKAVVGIESRDGQIEIQYSYKQPVLETNTMIAFAHADLSNPFTTVGRPDTES